ncbi:HPr(Ser) kinase/phosphatase [Thauera linaloolentis]|uniref:HPr kinase/phosphorylase n=1 Tax=Thauera linaloolentis (strain DSM 12138 / JCM 21573 / CCUG 41526 / CIP 105981 / IAM 15112 / NBRC 102519 / 47Lol) TaxID=1123367 RepID=N6XTE7_THAL4|nr:HPr(Ser) kinase/phosphatase [Thauera linaloolentis]ENO85011.1 HPr kinase/phosphorylase [Thauera linaloolentis 47Lol = DSM 12138]MCM8566809.1 HPr(Ser) kinase/phosphatase [Thauera linaloolentis]
MRQTSVARLFEAERELLQLSHVSGRLDATLSVAEEHIWPADLIGHLNLIHPTRLQVIGAAELAWAQRQTTDKVVHHLNGILSCQPPAIIVADGCAVSNIIHGVCEAHDVALFTTPQPAASVIDQLRLYLSRELAEKISLHGVFMDVLGVGVLITGDSGAGKSELALELISRGHGLVADDVVEFSRIAPTVLEGRCPPMLQDFIEVRGLGILNIRTIFGETACRRKMRLRLVCHLERRQPGDGDPSRLPVQQEVKDILGVKVARVVLPVAAGRNLAVLLEAAVRSTILQLRGIDAMQEFIDRQMRAMGDSDGAA